MTPKMKFIELIDDYLDDSLNGQKRLEFEDELKRNSELRVEMELEKEIQDAIIEKDILNLRNEIDQIIKTREKLKAGFELFEGFANIEQLNLNIPEEELLEFYDSLPKAHIYQHNLISKEIIHEFYKEQILAESAKVADAEDLDDPDLPDLEQALLEKDIMDLRNTLVKVSELVKLPYSSEEIEKYNMGELSKKEMENFEKELAVNSLLRREVEIYREVGHALEELDISKLRIRLSELMKTETSWNVSTQQIEEFIDGELEGRELEEFRTEYEVNTDLRSEVALRANVNKAIGEKDIISLSARLCEIRKDISSKGTKSIIPDNNENKFHWWRAGVAVAVILFLASGLFRSGFVSVEKTYDHYYRSPEWSPQRSVTSDLGYLDKANTYFSAGEYLEAIKLYDQAIKENRENSVFYFYKGASLQNLEKYEKAIPEYSVVIDNGNNLFVEEAEWNKSLCYLKLNKTNLAKEQLKAIIKRDGYYARDAKAVLRRLRYSLK
jgi:tetratricopeptide (TPR) repeat protein